MKSNKQISEVKKELQDKIDKDKIEREKLQYQKEREIKNS
jgi:hypothetical protein